MSYLLFQFGLFGPCEDEVLDVCQEGFLVVLVAEELAVVLGGAGKLIDPVYQLRFEGPCWSAVFLALCQ